MGGVRAWPGKAAFRHLSKLISIYLCLLSLLGSHIKEGPVAGLGWGRGAHVAWAFLLPSGK